MFEKVACKWDNWSEWSSCISPCAHDLSFDCLPCKKSRKREQITLPENGPLKCEESEIEEINCSDNEWCPGAIYVADILAVFLLTYINLFYSVHQGSISLSNFHLRLWIFSFSNF